MLEKTYEGQLQLTLVAFYLARSVDTVHYKSDETVNLCSFRCATASPITAFINFVFYIYICRFLLFRMPKVPATFRNLPQQNNIMFNFLLT